MTESRVRVVQPAPVRKDGDYVLYWMIAARRTRFNAGLEHAVAWGRELGKPVLVFEPLRVGYRWASVRHHAFVVQGMLDNAEAADRHGVTYLPYVEPTEGEGSGLLEALAARAAVVVTDLYPTFFLPHMVAAAGKRLGVRLEEVDSNGILPLAAHGRAFTVAHAYRRHLQKTVRPYLSQFPAAEPLQDHGLGRAVVPAEVTTRWPAADLRGLLEGGLARMPVDQTVGPVSYRGGQLTAQGVLASFLEHRLPRYAEERNDPSDDAGSGLSPWLHFGHLSAHEVVQAVLDRDGWTTDRLTVKPHGKREGWWRASPEVEAFLDEVITWREVGYGFCHHVPDHDRYESLPDWARTTLEEHADDERPHLYDLETLDASETHDELWNAAQRQLVLDGRIHNYLRMLWGKKILEWSPSPRAALDVLIELNNRYATDGRDPNSMSGIFWTLGRFDRAWGPERPIFGKIRYMSSDNTARKVPVKAYLDAWLGTSHRVRGSDSRTHSENA